MLRPQPTTAVWYANESTAPARWAFPTLFSLSLAQHPPETTRRAVSTTAKSSMTMVEIRRLLSLLACLGWLSLGAAQTMAPVPSASSSASSSSASGSESEEAPVIMMDAGSFHAVVIIRDSAVNVVKNWGANGQGQVRDGSDLLRKSSPFLGSFAGHFFFFRPWVWEQ